MNKRHICLLITLSALFFLLISCSRQTEQIRLGLIAPSTDHLPVGYGIKKGIIAEDDLRIHYFASGWEVNEALISNRIDVAIMPFTYAWQAVAEGKDVRIISFFERESDGIIARKGIKEMKDLDGLKLGTLRASTLDIFAHVVSDEFNIKPEMVYFRTPTEMAIALNNGLVDALSFYVPAIFNLGDEAEIIFWYSDLYPDHPCCDLVATGKAIENKRARLQDFVSALDKSCDLLNNDLNGGIELIVENYGLSADVAEKTLSNTKFITGFDERGIEFQELVVHKMMELGYLRRVVNSQEVYYDIFNDREENGN